MPTNLGWTFAKRFMGVLRAPAIRRFVNREYTDYLCSSAPPRPHGYSLWGPGDQISDYVSWASVSDHAFSARHLKPAKDQLPVPEAPAEGQPWDPVPALWQRQGELQPSIRSSVLFAFFAQWFTDSILRIDKRDRRRNTSTHNIDLCQIYGLDEATTRMLRSKDPAQRGQLAHRVVKGAEYPDLLFQDGAIKEQYRGLPYIGRLNELNDGFPPDRLDAFYAAGLERGNSSIGYVAISTLFLREHNRLCCELARQNESWDDERVFQTARNINIVTLLKLLLHDYINHILGEQLFTLEPGFADRRPWLRANWIALEFDLLYRWHGMMPSTLSLPGGKSLAQGEFRNNNRRFEELGIGKVLSITSAQPAGKIGLGNTPDFLMAAELESVRMARRFRLRSFNEYCKHFSIPPLRSFDDLTDDQTLAKRIADLYGNDVTRLEWLVGLFAQKADEGVLFGPLMARMVAYDALTQIYSNPLLGEHIYNEETFTAYGLDQIEKASLAELVRRNVREPDVNASFTSRLGTKP